ncbi:hypothetical protein BGZ60DRAFT_419076 [Tricladium varicosporioides]|nr:hypothetical protein BGZ60DRAFT_419076 [Hymenoscyphus varicosporioides]
MMAKTYETAKIWPSYPSSLCSETEATIHVFCINCKSLSERNWQGSIIGKGLHGSLNAFCARVKNKYMLFRSHTPLMRLLTVCIECCIQLELYYEADQIDRIFGFRDKNEPLREMVLRISYKEIEEFVSSKLIMMEGLLLNSETIKTASADGKWRKWYLWNQPRVFSGN